VAEGSALPSNEVVCFRNQWKIVQRPRELPRLSTRAQELSEAIEGNDAAACLFEQVAFVAEKSLDHNTRIQSWEHAFQQLCVSQLLLKGLNRPGRLVAGQPAPKSTPRRVRQRRDHDLFESSLNGAWAVRVRDPFIPNLSKELSDGAYIKMYLAGAVPERDFLWQGLHPDCIRNNPSHALVALEKPGRLGIDRPHDNLVSVSGGQIGESEFRERQLKGRLLPKGREYSADVINEGAVRSDDKH
jgi:hypothetical protein